MPRLLPCGSTRNGAGGTIADFSYVFCYLLLPTEPAVCQARQAKWVATSGWLAPCDQAGMTKHKLVNLPSLALQCGCLAKLSFCAGLTLCCPRRSDWYRLVCWQTVQLSTVAWGAAICQQEGCCSKIVSCVHLHGSHVGRGCRASVSVYVTAPWHVVLL